MKQKLILDAAKSIMDKKGKICINNLNKNEYQRGEGDYYIIKYDEYSLIKKKNLLCKKISKSINNLFKKNKIFINSKILIIGLGNNSIIADSFGPITANKLIATNHMDGLLTIPKIAIFNPNIVYKTGINSFKLIKMLVSDLKPNVIIFIDSLQTNDKENLNSVIEINDEGIIRGQSLNTFREINRNTFNIPIITIGIPFVYTEGNKTLTLPNINECIEELSAILSETLNKMFITN